MTHGVIYSEDFIDPEAPFPQSIESKRRRKQGNHSKPCILHPWLASQCSDLMLDLVSP
jgi:hypothetical protein